MLRAGLLTFMVSGLSPLHSRPSFTDFLLEAPGPPPEAGGRSLTQAVTQAGVYFWHFEDRTCYSTDSGKSWKLAHPYPRISLVQSGFVPLAGGILEYQIDDDKPWLYDFSREDWVQLDFGRGNISQSLGADGIRVVRNRQMDYKSPSYLEYSSDTGKTWTGLPWPGGRTGYFEKILVAGEGIVATDYQVERGSPAATLDWGKSWRILPLGSTAALDTGCYSWISDGEMRSVCRGRSEEKSVAVPFKSVRWLFSDGRGTFFALADSALYILESFASHPDWTVLASKEDLRGWTQTEGALHRKVDGKIQWFNPPTPPRPSLGVKRGKPWARRHSSISPRKWPSDGAEYRGFFWDFKGRFRF